MPYSIDLTRYGLRVERVLRNAAVPRLYEEAIRTGDGTLTSFGALATRSGEKTGRSPKDKRVVEHPESSGDIWWGEVNIKLDPHTFAMNRQQAVDYLNTRPQLYVQDGFAGWDPNYRLKIRVICARPYHALFMRNMLIRPTTEDLADFGDPDYVIYNAGEFPANRYNPHMTSSTSIDLDFKRREFVILGSQYAGEMKKGVFSIMHYLMPQQNVLSMHCSANESAEGDVALFFGLSGTGKTTLSADPRRRLIGDDEHCWSDEGVFNIEGGCYAKCINLSQEHEPEIFGAIRFGTVLENVVLDEQSRAAIYAEGSITENTRAAYPIEFVENAKVPCVGGHPKNIIFLTCDASGVLPPVSKLTPAEAMYHFVSGYTARVAGTEVGVTEPQVAFSACFSAAFLVWHPTRYAEMLAEKLREHGSQTWLVNTGWTGGEYGVGSRIKLAHTRAIVDAIHNGKLAQTPTVEDPLFGFEVPTGCPNVPERLLLPSRTWSDEAIYRRAAERLAHRFQNNFAKYADAASEETRQAGPRV
jgi:phosphoenolpyruvate carboxykinase (ATP)